MPWPLPMWLPNGLRYLSMVGSFHVMVVVVRVTSAKPNGTKPIPITIVVPKIQLAQAVTP